MNGENQLTKEEQALLTEYQVCQSHNNSLGQQSWVSISILITVNLLVLAQVIVNIVLTTVPNSGWAKPVFVFLLGVVMIAILWIFKRWDKRIAFMALLNNERMRNIETKLEIWKNWRHYGLDLLHRKRKKGQQEKLAKEEWKKLLSSQKKYIEQLNKQLDKKNGEWSYVPPTTDAEFWKLRWKFDWIFPILIILWGIIIVIEALTYCPAVYRWLFN